MASDRSVNLAKRAAENLPAYRDLLNSNELSKADISAQTFDRLPLTDKNNYLRKYQLEELTWQRDRSGLMLFCSTSGSTGEPFYFPRNEELSRQYAVLLELFLARNKPAGKGKTLVIVGFGMGVWIGGVFTMRAFEIAAQQSRLAVSILPTGYNKPEIFKALSKLAPQFDQTIIVGYPPFIKELVDEAPAEDIDLTKLNIRLLFAAEAFTETFRDYVSKKAGITRPMIDTLNIYGTADIGAMAYESPTSILIRRLADKDPLLFQDVFGQIEKTPTLAQFNPKVVEFEAVNGEVVLTADAALPLIRYSVGDNGGVIQYTDMLSILHRNGYTLADEMKKAGQIEHLTKEPFVFVFERKDLSASLHGINIYPEFIKEGLLDERLVPSFTERFTMISRTDRHHSQYLEINLELQRGAEPTAALKKQTERIIRDHLIQKSSEFAEISKSPKSKKLLKFVYWPKGHTRYFMPGVKQKWVQAVK